MKAGMRIACPSCHGGGDVARDYGARMSDGSAGTAAVVTTCRPCKGSGWITHPGKWKSVPERERGTEAG